MCTVTFVLKSNSDFILTSNRDEAPGRKTLPPKVYTINGVELLFPKDELAGGTWIGVSKQKRLICLMNGGFTAHKREEKYRMSRGIIVTDLLTSENAVVEIETYNFDEIEPFTIIMADWKNSLHLFELVWDGIKVHLSEKPLEPQIWSSSLLYTEAMKKKREQWFSDFLVKNPNPSKEELIHFHKTAGEGNIETNLIMDREFVKTKSITQIFQTGTTKMSYEDLQTQQISLISLAV